jgi:hypothetical protein
VLLKLATADHRKAKEDQPSNRSLKYGENAAYLQARLRRDAPEVAVCTALE